MIVKIGAFAVGFGFFGDPVFQWTLKFLNHTVPDWKKHLDLQQYAPENPQNYFPLLKIHSGHF